MWISLTTFGRFKYTIKTLESLALSDFPEDSHLVIRDDITKNLAMVEYLKNFVKRSIKNLSMELIINKKPLGCDPNMLEGLKYCLSKSSDQFATTIDNDSLFNSQWLKKLLEVKDYLEKANQPIGAISVFNTISQTGQHAFVDKINEEIGIKNDIGGFAAAINRRIFEEYDFYGPKKSVGWDWNMCHKFKELGLKIYCTYRSYVEHIGAIGEHSNGKERKGDRAINFIP